MYKYTTGIGDIHKIRNLDHPLSKTKSHSGNTRERCFFLFIEFLAFQPSCVFPAPLGKYDTLILRLVSQKIRMQYLHGLLETVQYAPLLEANNGH